MVYVNTVHADHIEEPSAAGLSAGDVRMLDNLKQRLHAKGLELDPAKVGTDPILTRCEVTHTWCFCVEVGTKKTKGRQNKSRKTLASNGKKS